MFPQLFHIGRFFLPTYGVLVSLGVLVGLWVSVRNSRKQGINPDDAWNLGILVVLCGIVGAKLLMFINEWDSYIRHPSEIFTWNTFQAAGGLVHPQTQHAAIGHLRCFCSGTGARARDWTGRLFCRWLLLWEAYASLLGGDVYQPGCARYSWHPTE